MLAKSAGMLKNRLAAMRTKLRKAWSEAAREAALVARQSHASRKETVGHAMTARDQWMKNPANSGKTTPWHNHPMFSDMSDNEAIMRYHKSDVKKVWSEEAREASAEARRRSAKHSEAAGDHKRAARDNFSNPTSAASHNRAAQYHSNAANYYDRAASAFDRGSRDTGSDAFTSAERAGSTADVYSRSTPIGYSYSIGNQRVR